MTAFRDGEGIWVHRFGNLRNAVRQELVARQIATSVGVAGSVLDVGCGQGEQARRLLEAGWRVTGVDPSEELLGIFRSSCSTVETPPELITGGIEDIDELLAGRRFDLVCAHGLLMYLDDSPAAIQALAHRVVSGGLLSLTFRNGDALAMRSGIRHDWSSTLKAFDSTSYVNELGVSARADRFDAIEAALTDAGLSIEDWFGVRVFTDGVEPDTPLPSSPAELAALLEAEDRAGRLDPYRRVASQIHVIASRPPS